MPDSYSVELDVNQVRRNLAEIDNRMKAAIKVAGDTVGQGMKVHAQANAAWTDRTGDARQEIDYNVDMKEKSIDIAVFHKMEYGLWLEKRESFAGRFSILEAARDSQVETFKTMLRELRL